MVSESSSEGNMGLLFIKYRASVCDDEKVLDMDSGGSCTIL